LNALQSGNLAIGQGASDFENGVLRALAYSDIFDFPLTAEEVREALPFEAALIEVEAALDAIGSRIAFVAYYMLAGREEIAETRERRRVASAALIDQARWWGRLIGALPFVRSVVVTGSLAVDNAEMGDDIDYLVVTKPGRVWTARALVVAVVRVARLRGVELCPNFVVAEDALAMDDNAYVARELVQMRPVTGIDVARRLLDENAWWRCYLPNATPAVLAESTAKTPRRLQAVAESFLGGRIGDLIEAALLRHKGESLRRAAGANPEAVFDASMAKGHVEAHRGRIEAALTARVETLGLLP
jgi:hypothetical protein